MNSSNLPSSPSIKGSEINPDRLAEPHFYLDIDCIKIMDALTHNYVRVAHISDLEAKGYLVVRVAGQTIALFQYDDRIYAVDNRCPHMGFPLPQGSVSNCILTCHWHHARFDLESGGTFDPWADDVRSFPVEIRSGEVWLDLNDHLDAKTHAQQRLIDGLEQSISLIIAKSVLALLAQRIDPTEAFQVGLDFGVLYRDRGWGAGLTDTADELNNTQIFL